MKQDGAVFLLNFTCFAVCFQKKYIYLSSLLCTYRNPKLNLVLIELGQNEGWKARRRRAS